MTNRSRNTSTTAPSTDESFFSPDALGGASGGEAPPPPAGSPLVSTGRVKPPLVVDDPNAKGTFFGVPEERSRTVSVTCTDVRDLGMGDYGRRFLIRFTIHAPDGLQHDAVWFTGEGGKFDPQPGTDYVVDFSVARHTVFNNRRQTQITRVTASKGHESETPW